MDIRSYKDLTVWQKAMDLAAEIYRLVKKLPKDEMYALSNQMRRAAVSIPSNIAEGHARKSTKEFANFLSIAQGSKAELETQVELCKKFGYITEADTLNTIELLSEVGKMLTSLLKKLTPNP